MTLLVCDIIFFLPYKLCFYWQIECKIAIFEMNFMNNLESDAPNQHFCTLLYYFTY